MDKKIPLVAAVGMALIISGCAAWSKTNGYYRNPSQKYSTELPWGWMRYRGNDLLLTKDGVFLEAITVIRRNIKDKLEFTKKLFGKGMLPEEIAEIIIDDLKASNKIGNLEIIENSPAKIGGRDAFKLVYSFTTESGLKKRCIHYGFGYEKWVYEVSYSGTDWHYFDKGVNDFEQMVESFKFLG